jgi:hypothetical protein
VLILGRESAEMGEIEGEGILEGWIAGIGKQSVELHQSSLLKAWGRQMLCSGTARARARRGMI